MVLLKDKACVLFSYLRLSTAAFSSSDCSLRLINSNRKMKRETIKFFFKYMHIKNERKYRIGTDQPKKLLAAVESALAGPN